MRRILLGHTTQLFSASASARITASAVSWRTRGSRARHRRGRRSDGSLAMIIIGPLEPLSPRSRSDLRGERAARRGLDCHRDLQREYRRERSGGTGAATRPGRARLLIEENRQAQVENFTVQARLIADLSRLKAAVGGPTPTRPGRSSRNISRSSRPTFSWSLTDTAGCSRGFPRAGSVVRQNACRRPEMRSPARTRSRLSAIPASCSWFLCHSGSAPPTRLDRKFSARSASGSA